MYMPMDPVGGIATKLMSHSGMTKRFEKLDKHGMLSSFGPVVL